MTISCSACLSPGCSLYCHKKKRQKESPRDVPRKDVTLRLMVLLPCIAYQITSVRDSIFLPESRDYICPTCRKGHLHYRDHCRRIVRHEGGEAEWFFIPRSRCDNAGCRRLHSGVLDGFVTPEDADSEDRPSADTMKRWHHWLMANEQYIDGTLKSVGFRDLGFGEELLRSGISLLRELRRSSERWLETILCFIYNSGGFLVPA